MKKASVLLLLLIYLGIYGDHLALWSDRSTVPLQVFPYLAEVYPDADQQSLRHGIPITSQPEACRIFEDYFS